MATLAGQRAQFTWALRQYNLAEDAERKTFYARRMARYIATAPANGFTVEQVVGSTPTMTKPRRQVIAHVPHASDRLPTEVTYLIDSRPERDLVTDWFTDDLIDVDELDERVVFPWSRIYCDVERFEQDPLEQRGQGLYYTRTLDGRSLRERDAAAHADVLRHYRAHHAEVEAAVAAALRRGPACLIDMHSFSDKQVRLSGLPQPTPDVCLGFDERHAPGDLVTSLAKLFEQRGYSVALNQPYAGALVPPAGAGHPLFTAVMIEVNKRLYLQDVRRPERSDAYATLKCAIGEAVSIIKGTA